MSEQNPGPPPAQNPFQGWLNPLLERLESRQVDGMTRMVAMETLLNERTRVFLEMEDQLQRIAQSVEAIKLTLAEAQGAKKAVYAVAALLGSVGGIAATLFLALLHR